LIAALAVVFLALVGYQTVTIHRIKADPQLVNELQDAHLQPTAAPTVDLDWPAWRGPRRDGVVQTPHPITPWPAGGPKVLWEEPAGSGYSAPVIAGSRLYLFYQDGDNETLVCRDAATGKQHWTMPDRCRYVNGYGNGPRSTPSVVDGKVYCVGGTGRLRCLNSETGKELWAHDLLQEFQAPNIQWGVSFSPLVEGDLLFTMPGGPDGGSLAAFDRRDGRLVWKSQSDPAGYSSPVAATLAGVRQILFLTGTRLVSVAPTTGELLWSFSWPTDFQCNAATPIAVGDYVFISSNYGKGCALLKITATGGHLSIASVYETRYMRNHFSSSVLIGDYLYGFDDANLTCLELRTGEARWRERGFNKGSVLGVGDQLLVLGEDGKLALAKATPDGWQRLASARPLSSKCWTVPVLAGGRLYLRDESKLLCLALTE
jgi:outer membrane protein assembly factor BamB